MASCSKCSRPIEPGDTFCASCGARTAEAPSALQPEGGSAPLPRPSALTQSLPPVQQPNYVAPRPLVKPGALARMPATGWLLCGGAAAIALGSLLPWAQVSNAIGITISASPRGGGPVLLMVLAAAALWIGWPAIRSKLSKRRLAGLTLVAGVLSIFVVTNWSDIGQLQSTNPDAQITAGSGLFLYTAGVVVMWVCVARVWLAGRRPLTTAL